MLCKLTTLQQLYPTADGDTTVTHFQGGVLLHSMRHVQGEQEDIHPKTISMKHPLFCCSSLQEAEEDMAGVMTATEIC